MSHVMFIRAFRRRQAPEKTRRTIFAPLLGIAISLAAAVAGASTVAAQSCALCYQSAAASGPRFIHALRDGILILLFPPLLISVGIAVMAYRKRNLSGSDERRVKISKSFRFGQSPGQFLASCWLRVRATPVCRSNRRLRRVESHLTD